MVERVRDECELVAVLTIALFSASGRLCFGLFESFFFKQI